MDKPTSEQVAWVFRQIINNTNKEQGTFRYLIYDRMGFSTNNYLELYKAGGMVINNGMLQYFHEEYKDINNIL